MKFLLPSSVGLLGLMVLAGCHSNKPAVEEAPLVVSVESIQGPPSDRSLLRSLPRWSLTKLIAPLASSRAPTFDADGPGGSVSIVSLGSWLLVNQDFTSDHQLLKEQAQAFSAGSGQGSKGTPGTTEGTPDTGRPITADDTEYNISNTDRRLEALRSVSEKSPISTEEDR